MINVKSEIGVLKKVLLHRPGVETEMLTPNTFEELLFDDSYYLEVAQKEHDAFAELLKNEGIEVVYIEDLAADVLEDEALRNKFIAQFIEEAGIRDEHITEATTKYINSIGNVRDMVIKMMAGVRYTDIESYRPEGTKTLFELAIDSVFVLKPLPNLVFTRDPFASIHNGVSLHKMASETRSRESIFSQYVIENHKDFKDVPKYYDRNLPTTLEGGDVMVLNDTTLAVGLSVRSEAESIEVLAKNIFENTGIETILAVNIPKGRNWMHLDTVFTQMDIDKFSVYTDYPFTIFKIVKGNNKIEELHGTLEEIFSDVFGVKAQMVITGDGDPIHAAREQWNDGSNVLTIRPGHVVSYERNYVSNKCMEDAGITVHTIPSSELSRGRGGPRCMSMPLIREDVDWESLK